MITAWLYFQGKPLTAVRVPKSESTVGIIDKALHDLEVCPLVICPQGVAPCEMEARIRQANIRYFNTQ